MELEEYFVELLDRNILIEFPDDRNSAIFKVEGWSRHDYSISTLPNVFRDLANNAEILENIFINLKNEMNSKFYIEFEQMLEDYKSELKVQFTFKFTNKYKKVQQNLDSLYNDFFDDF